MNQDQKLRQRVRDAMKARYRGRTRIEENPEAFSREERIEKPMRWAKLSYEARHNEMRSSKEELHGVAVNLIEASMTVLRSPGNRAVMNSFVEAVEDCREMCDVVGQELADACEIESLTHRIHCLRFVACVGRSVVAEADTLEELLEVCERRAGE